MWAMPSDDYYAKCNFTRSGMSEIHFEVIIKVPKSTFEALRRDPRTKNLSNTQVFANDVARRYVALLLRKAWWV